MTRDEAISQLRDLIRDREALIDKEEPESVFQDDIDALNIAIELLENANKAQTRRSRTSDEMNRERCIEALRGSMELYLFDPNTGNVNEPEQLNELNRMTYDAMEYAADFIESHPQVGAHSWFYTFGTDPRFPHGIEEYVEVHADTRNQADQKFKSRYPCREESNLLNCAWIYSEKEWERIYKEHYSGKRPARVID